MKLKFFFLLVVGLIACWIFYHAPINQNVSRKPVAKISFQTRNSEFKFGDSISIAITIKTKNGELKESKLYIDNELVKSSNQTEYSLFHCSVRRIGKTQCKSTRHQSRWGKRE